MWLHVLCFDFVLNLQILGAFHLLHCDCEEYNNKNTHQCSIGLVILHTQINLLQGDGHTLLQNLCNIFTCPTAIVIFIGTPEPLSNLSK